MLSFDTVHTLTDCLIRLQHDDRLTAAPELLATLILAHDSPAGSTSGHLRRMRLMQLPLLADSPGHHTLAAALRQVADAVSDHPGQAIAGGPLHTSDFNLLAATLRSDRPDLRLLAWAVCYDDIHTTAPDRVWLMRRVDAVDADGRVYQLSRRPDETHPIVNLDERPNPNDLPATYPPLARLATGTPSDATPHP